LNLINENFQSGDDIENFQSSDNVETFISLNEIGKNNKNNIKPQKDDMKLKYNKLMIKNKELNVSKDKLEDKIKEQKRAFYISSNFDKIDDESFSDLHIIARNFSSDGYPQINLKNYEVVRNKKQMEKVVNKAQGFKNMYKPGDIVDDNSSFNITRDNICYRSDGKPMKLTKEFKKKYPECMVCNLVPKKELKDSDSWRNTKTNINEVCLFNPDSENNSGIPNLKECQSMCKI
jgi:hypothetical protein